MSYGPEPGEIEERWEIRRAGEGCFCDDPDVERCRACLLLGDCDCHRGPIWDPTGMEPE